MPADAAATPENPSAAAIIATTRKMTDQVNIGISFKMGYLIKVQFSYLKKSPEHSVC